MPFSVSSWNINSIRTRAALVLDWLEQHPDCLTVALQEIKCEEAQFPTCFQEKGYHIAVKGQKAHHGVAFISRCPLNVTATALEGQEDSGSRYLEAEIETSLGKILLGNLYLPNGNSHGEAGLEQKLNFFEALYLRAQKHLKQGREFILLGDYNVCPTPKDYAPGALTPQDALLHPKSIKGFRKLEWLGLTDAVRALHPNDILYSFFDYQGGAFQKKQGLRIDHALLTPKLAEALTSAEIDLAERGKEKPSDHAPLLLSFTPPERKFYPFTPLPAL